ncbi:hypothetical protein [Vampirovibrio chlorellavorus]|uniref:hypothetical protein n=1 Tax=Vampirovibrio chlorellavorus TaxID=758823 RepID=UPI0026EAB3E7|nr:hypothetical protein [Vampirovibrio chlorellavorus]
MRIRDPKGIRAGFSLSELLISLLILAEIATFTIPKVLSAQQNGQNNARAKSVAAMISEAFYIHKINGLVNANTRATDLTPYMNYISYDTTSGSTVDNTPRYSWWYTCNSFYPCMDLHGGGVLLLLNNCRLGGTTSLNYLDFLYDPDGTFNGDYVVNTFNGQGKSIYFALYADGFLTTRNKMRAGSIQGGCAGTTGPDTGFDPSWFSW